jgi:hypothetical protein
MILTQYIEGISQKSLQNGQKKINSPLFAQITNKKAPEGAFLVWYPAFAGMTD